MCTMSELAIFFFYVHVLNLRRIEGGNFFIWGKNIFLLGGGWAGEQERMCRTSGLLWLISKDVKNTN